MVEDDQFQKSHALLPVYKFESDSIEPYSRFGVDIPDDLPWLKIRKMPNMEGCRDTGYTFIYFSGADNEANQGYLLCLIGNYHTSVRTIYFHVDRNNDLDFTNDGPPDSLGYFDHELTIELENIHAPGAKYAAKLSRYRSNYNMVNYDKMLTDHYRAHSGKKKFTRITYCYREQRYNTVLAHFKEGQDSFTIGLKDMNVNGLYNDACADQWYIGPYGSTVVATELMDLTPTVSKNVFEWNGKKYRFRSIESTGAFVEIVEDKYAKLSNKLEVGERGPNFSYYNILNKEHELKEYKKKEVYLFFWDLENLSDEDTLYLGKIHREYADRIQLITLNHGDKPKNVRIFFFYDQIQWPIGYSNSSIADLYFLEDVNRGFYMGKGCKIRDEKISPKGNVRGTVQHYLRSFLTFIHA